jgi:hypothetical protein
MDENGCFFVCYINPIRKTKSNLIIFKDEWLTCNF